MRQVHTVYANNFFFNIKCTYLLCLQGILALKVVDELTMWFFTIGGHHYYYNFSKLCNILVFSSKVTQACFLNSKQTYPLLFRLYNQSQQAYYVIWVLGDIDYL
jgi:hypothetical protein